MLSFPFLFNYTTTHNNDTIVVSSTSTIFALDTHSDHDEFYRISIFSNNNTSIPSEAENRNTSRSSSISIHALSKNVTTTAPTNNKAASSNGTIPYVSNQSTLQPSLSPTTQSKKKSRVPLLSSSNNNSLLQSKLSQKPALSPALSPTNHPSRALLEETFNVSMILSPFPTIMDNDTIALWENVTNTYYEDYYDTTKEHFWDLNGILQLFLSTHIQSQENASTSGSIHANDFKSITTNTAATTALKNSLYISYSQTIQYLSYDTSNGTAPIDIITKPMLQQGNATYLNALQDTNETIFGDVQTISSFKINGIQQLITETSTAKTSTNDGLIPALRNSNIDKQHFLIGMSTVDAIILVAICTVLFIRRKSIFPRNIDMDEPKDSDEMNRSIQSWADSSIANSNIDSNYNQHKKIFQLVIPPGKLNVILGTQKHEQSAGPPTVVCVRGSNAGDRMLRVGDQILMVDGIDISSYEPNDVALMMIKNRDLNRKLTIAR